MAKVVKTPDKYPIPSNWLWVKLGDLSETKSGYPFDSKRFTVKNESAKPLIRIRDVVRGYTETYTDEECPDSYIIKNGDILIGMDGDFNVSKWQSEDALLNQRVCTIKSSSKLLLDDFLFYFLPQPLKQVNDATPSVTVKHLSTSTISKILIPVPPLAEQKRIVDTITELFADLDKAVENAQQIVDEYEQRRAAILAAAFAGNLTEQWRETNHIDIGSWQELSLSDLGILERGRSKHRPRNDERLFGGDYPFIQTGDVAGANVYVTHHTQTLSEFGMAQSRLFPAGTLCITIAANIGDVAILSYDCCFPDSVVGFTPNEKTSSKYVYYMMSVLQKELEANAPATAQKNINLKVLNDVRISTPSREEQDEIVRILDELLADEQRIKEAAEETLAKIDLMKKSIFADAFRGKLGTNDPSDQPATELLKQILA